MKHFFLFIGLLFFQINIDAQEAVYLIDIKKSCQKKFQKAKNLSKEKKTSEAIKLFEELNAKYSTLVDAKLELAKIHFNQNEFAKSTNYFNEVVKLSDKFNPNIWFGLAESYKSNDDYNSAISTLDTILSKEILHPDKAKTIQKYRSQWSFIKEAKENPVDFNPIRLGDSINTINSEYLPQFIAEGDMIFTRRINRQEDLFISKSKGNHEYGNSFSLETLNTNQNEGAHTISADGNYMLFTSCDRREGLGSCDLYITTKRNENWSTPVNLGSGFNTRNWEAQPYISADKRMIFFSSNRPGGFGLKDIWYVRMLESGEWSDPINAGKEINSKGNESSPFLHADGESFYFRSDGHLGLGNHDIFKANFASDTFSMVINLGYPINTEADEGALAISLDGKFAYYASDIDTDPPNLDIFYFELPENLRPKANSYVKVSVIDAESKTPINAIFEIFDVKKNESVDKVQVGDDGIALITLNVDGDYAINIRKKDYDYFSENFNLSADNSNLNPKIIVAELHKLVANSTQENSPIVLHNIFFKSGSSDLLPSSNFEIQKLQTLLTTNPKLEIKIIGHTDNVGQAEDNLTLSKMRAESVKNELINRGIESHRLTTQGLGETSPISNNDTVEGKRINRRTEFQIINQ